MQHAGSVVAIFKLRTKLEWLQTDFEYLKKRMFKRTKLTSLVCSAEINKQIKGALHPGARTGQSS